MHKKRTRRLFLYPILLILLFHSGQSKPVVSAERETTSPVARQTPGNQTSALWNPFLFTAAVPRHPFTGLVLFLGASFRNSWQPPLLAVQGALHRLGEVSLHYLVASGVRVEISGIFYQHLRVARSASRFRPAARYSDVGDFQIATLLRLWPGRKILPYGGLRVAVRLPNTNQKRGLGTNTTDLFLSLNLNSRLSRVAFRVEAGVGILSAPLEVNNQNDVALFGVALLWNLNRKWTLLAEVSGYFNTRGVIPRGTENRGIAQLGIGYRVKRWAAGLFLQHGLVKRSGGPGLRLGLSGHLPFARKSSF